MYIYIYLYLYICIYHSIPVIVHCSIKIPCTEATSAWTTPGYAAAAWSAATCAVRSCRSSTVRPGFKRRKWVDWWFCELKYAKVVEMRWILWFIGTPNSFSRQPHLVFISGWQRGNHGDNICTTWTTHADWDTPHQHLLHHLGQHH